MVQSIVETFYYLLMEYSYISLKLALMKDLVLFILLLTSISCYSQEDIIRSQDIESVTVEATRGKEIAFEDSKYYIIDFHINNQGKFLLVSNRRKYFVYLLDTRMEVKDKMKLDFHPRSIYYDCLGLLHVLAKDSMYQIEIIEDKLVIYERNSIMLLTRFFNNCVAESNETVIFGSLC